ncbi:MAG: UvrD-helicase domain-containing protein [Planctomycetes bacterium]|nr:UvrD-helicase domain-containing protein [Planctomycetota bacterium]
MQNNTPLPDQEARDRILTALDRNMLVEAAAGTGKTTSMVGRMVALLRTGRCEVGAIAAVTFTRKAATELRARFQIKLEQAVAGAEGEEKSNLQAALENVERCFIGTIHSFCSRLLRERPIEAGVEVSFRELEEDDDGRLREEAWNLYTSEQLVAETGNAIAELESLGLHYELLQDGFLRFVNYPDVDTWPVGGEQPAPQLDRIIRAVKAYAMHMQKLSPDLPEECGRDPLIPYYRSLPRILHLHELADPVPLMEFLERCKKAKPIQKHWPKGKEQAKAEEERWETFRSEIVAPTLEWWYEKRYAVIIRIFNEARQLYDRLRQERGVLNFQDLLMKASALLRDQPHVRAYFRKRFTHLLVDEFQDTDPIQAEVMMFLTAENVREKDWRKCRPRPGSLFVVGDPKQSIYRFRRADIMTYNEVREIIGGTSADETSGEVVQLSCNFRSSGEIINWVNQTFASKFPANATDESPAYVSLQPGRKIISQPAGLSGIYNLEIPGENSKTAAAAIAYEADLIARTIRKELDNNSSPARSPSDFMIITDGRADLSTYARSLQGYNIPSQVTGGTALNEVRELEMLHTCLRAVLEPDNPVALVALLRSEVFGVSDTELYAFKKAGGKFSYPENFPAGVVGDPMPSMAGIYMPLLQLQKYSRWLAKLPPIAAIEEISADLGLVALAGAREGGDLEAGGFGKAMELLRSAQQEMFSVSQLVEHLQRIVERGEKFDSISALSEDRPVVRIMNLHKVKGLEAPVVFLANANRLFEHPVEFHIDRSRGKTSGYLAINYKPSGSFHSVPLALPPGWEQLAAGERIFLSAEETRLRYVAATRAGQALIITQKEKYNNRNPWNSFSDDLSHAALLPDPGPQKPLKLKAQKQPLTDVEQTAEKISARRTQAIKPSYRVLRAIDYTKESRESAEGITREDIFIEKTDQGLERIPPEAAGPEWGSVIHALLEVAMDSPEVALLPFAKLFLEENGISLSLADSSVKTAQAITQSEIWQRARVSACRFTETPFQVLHPAGKSEPEQTPVLITGVIDLAFQEEGGWVIVDYKTDRLADKEIETLVEVYRPQLLLYADAWEECTGEKVKETGLYFTRADKLVTLKRG